MLSSLAAKYRRLSLARKLTVAMLLTSTVTLLIACAVLAVYDYSASRARTMQELTVLADVVGADATAPVAFNDPKASADTLRALAADPHIIGARLFTNEGVQLATYLRHGADDGGERAASRFAPGTFVNSGTLRVVRPILLDGHPSARSRSSRISLKLWRAWNGLRASSRSSRSPHSGLPSGCRAPPPAWPTRRSATSSPRRVWCESVISTTCERRRPPTMKSAS